LSDKIDDGAMNDLDMNVSREAITLRMRVEDKLRSAISAGVFKPGQRLIERELCELTGVGRTSIREAVRQLEAEGLITSVPHRGPVVTRVSVEEARQLYAVRALLEGAAGRAFAERRPAEPLAQMFKSVGELEVAAKAGNREALIKAKTRFYDALMRGCGNVFIQQMLTNLHNRVTMLRATSMTHPGRLQKSLKEIRNIADLIAAGDAAGAEKARIDHIHTASTVALAVLSELEKESKKETLNVRKASSLGKV
jgi:DNA-binding GntR family transcriptional regulator